jgi:hypothetical protein
MYASSATSRLLASASHAAFADSFWCGTVTGELDELVECGVGGDVELARVDERDVAYTKPTASPMATTSTMRQTTNHFLDEPL